MKTSRINRKSAAGAAVPVAKGSRIGVLIITDCAVTGRGMEQMINAHARFCVCGMAGSASAASQACEEHRPAVVVVDLSVDRDGFFLLKELARSNPAVKLVVYSDVVDALSVQRALAAGAHGYVTRRDPEEEMMAALVTALEGRRYVGSQVRHLLLDGLALGTMKVNGKPEAALSDRELQVYRLVGRGRRTGEIAQELGVSVKTVETHKQRIKEKLRLASGAALQQHAALSAGGKKGAG